MLETAADDADGTGEPVVLCADWGSFELSLLHALASRRFDVIQRAEFEDAGIVDQHIKPAKRLLGVLEQARYVGF